MNKQAGATFTIVLIILLIIGVLLAIVFLIQTNLFDGFTPSPNTLSSPNPVPATSSATYSGCNLDCQAQIDAKLALLKQDLLKQLGGKIATPQASTPPQTSLPSKELFVYFGVNGSSQSTSWVDVLGSDIKFNLANYPGAKAFYFQSSLQSDAPDRASYARVYDVTHLSGVAGSEVNFTGITPTFVESSSLSFSSGDLQLRIQLHGILNYTTIYNPRIRIVY